MLFWGATLIVSGILILLNRAGILDLQLGEYIVPALLIIFGVRMLFSKKRSK
ncbi:hypothetical protein JYU19_01805 [bacterium AH-315-J21]|nr:hypothetical protein [bacterium AH-315-J21]